MKTKNILLLLVFVACTLSSIQTKAQAEIIFDNVVTFKDSTIDGYFESINSKTILSPFGNITKTATFQLPKDNYLVPERGLNYIIARVKKTNIDGEEEVMYDAWVEIPKNGRFKIVVHSNGAGNKFPALFKNYDFEQ